MKQYVNSTELFIASASRGRVSGSFVSTKPEDLHWKNSKKKLSRNHGGLPLLSVFYFDETTS